MTNADPLEIEFTDREPRKRTVLRGLRMDRECGQTVSTVLGIDRANRVSTTSALCLMARVHELHNAPG
jgi:hypothetical protein